MKKASLILLFNLFFLSSIHAAVIDYCFVASTSLSSVQSHLQTVLSPRDEVIINNSSHCLNVVMNNDFKEELYRKWISRKYQIISSSGFSDKRVAPRVSEQEHCRLEMERITSVDSTTRGGRLSQNSKAYERNFKHSGSQKSSIVLSVGRPGSLRVDDDYLNVICKSQNSSRVFLDIALTGIKSSVSTSVTLDRGQSLNLASIVEDLNDRFRELSLKNGVSLEKTKGQKQYQYYLRVKD